MVTVPRVLQATLFQKNSSAKFKIKTVNSITVYAQRVLLVSKDIVWTAEVDANMLTITVYHSTLMVFV